MKKILRTVFLLTSALLLSQCSTGLIPGVNSAPIVLPGTNKPTAFRLKGVEGTARQSQIMAAMERVQEASQRDTKNKRHPLFRLVRQYSPEGDAVFAIISKSVEAQRRDGRPMTVILPALVFEAPQVPRNVLARTVPEIQAYAFRIMSAEFTPVSASDLKKADGTQYYNER